MALEALYVDPDLAGRLRFKQTARSCPQVANIVSTNTLMEALERLDAQRPYDVVYISDRFSKEVLTQFIKSTQRNQPRGNIAFMVVIEGTSCDVNTLASYALVGADGFLLEPYSAQSMAESFVFAQKAIEARSVRNKELIVELLVKAMLANFSDYVRRLKDRKSVVPARTAIFQTQDLIAGLSKEHQERFHAELIERLITRPSPRGRVIRPSRGGYSPTRRVIRSH